MFANTLTFLARDKTYFTVLTCSGAVVRILIFQELMTEEHWLRMRDTGFMDEEGFLTVTGRCSDFVKLDTEEQVVVTPMEQRARLELACVSQCVIVPSPARDSLGLIITLDTIADSNNTLNLSQSAVNWFKHARFDVKTVTDVVSNMETGIKHVIQVSTRDHSALACIY